MTWAEINNRRLPFIRMGEGLFQGMYGEIRKGLVSSIEKPNTTGEIIEAVKNFVINEEIVYRDYERFYIRTGIAFAKSAIKGIRKNIEIKQEDDWMAEIIEYVRTKTGIKITSTIRSHYRDIEKVTSEAVKLGIENGWGMDKIARQIKNTQKEIDLWKALRIARTEVVAASNLGVKVGTDDLPGNKEKVWISTFDQRSRPDHIAMDGVRIPANEMFTLPSGVTLNFPGDPECLEASEIINCRCAYEIIITSDLY